MFQLSRVAACHRQKDAATMDKWWLSVFTALVFQTLHSCSGQPDLICSRGPITVLARDDVILPCRLEPSIRADSMTIMWIKPGLEPKYVHYHEDGRLIYQSQNPSYHYRTRLFVDELKNGNVSMKIMKVVLSDGGEYKCFIPSIEKKASIELIVGSVSSPVVSITNSTSIRGGVVLQCESAGWYPEPEVLWLDTEGNLLSAGPPETVRGPDDLYTVSSRVTVDKRHSNSFTCRVQQNNIKQTREAHIHVPDKFFKTPSSSSSSTSDIIAIVTGIVILILLIIVSVVFIRKLIQKKKKNQGSIKNNQSDSTNHDVLPLNDGRRNSLDKREQLLMEGTVTDHSWTPCSSPTDQTDLWMMLSTCPSTSSSSTWTPQIICQGPVCGFQLGTLQVDHRLPV